MSQAPGLSPCQRYGLVAIRDLQASYFQETDQARGLRAFVCVSYLSSDSTQRAAARTVLMVAPLLGNGSSMTTCAEGGVGIVPRTCPSSPSKNTPTVSELPDAGPWDDLRHRIPWVRDRRLTIFAMSAPSR